jgi:hypothetical protein
MKTSPLPRALAVIFAAALGNFPATAAACTVCMGDVNSKTAPAINAAIFLMLGFIGFMLAAAAGFGFYLMKRANSPLPPHTEFTDDDSQ